MAHLFLFLFQCLTRISYHQGCNNDFKRGGVKCSREAQICFFHPPLFYSCPPRKYKIPKNLIPYKLQGCNMDLKSGGGWSAWFFSKKKIRQEISASWTFDRGGGEVDKRFLFDTFWGGAAGGAVDLKFLGGLCPQFLLGGIAPPVKTGGAS